MLNSLNLFFPLKSTIDTGSSLVQLHLVFLISQLSTLLNVHEFVEPIRSKRQRIETSYGPGFITSFLVKIPDIIDYYIVSAFIVNEDHKTFNEAMTSIDATFWKEAILS